MARALYRSMVIPDTTYWGMLNLKSTTEQLGTFSPLREREGMQHPFTLKIEFRSSRVP